MRQSAQASQNVTSMNPRLDEPSSEDDIPSPSKDETPRLTVPFLESPEVRIPLVAVIDDESYSASSWSYSAAVIPGKIEGLPEDDRRSVVLRIGTDSILEIQTSVMLRATTSDQGKIETRIEFDRLTPAHAELLYRLVGDHVAGADDFLRLLDDSDSYKHKSASAIARRVRIWLTVAFVGALLLVTGWTVYLAMATVRSEYAAVSARGRNMVMPVTGILKDNLPSRWTSVKRGELLGEVESSIVSKSLAELRRQEIEIMGEISVTEAQISVVRKTQDIAQEQLEEKRGILKSELDLGVRQHELAKKQLERLGVLGDIVSQTSIDEQNIKVLEIEERLQAIRLEISDTESQIAFSKNNVDGINVNDNNLVENVLVAKLNSDMRKLSVIRSERDELMRSIRIVAPCDCIIGTTFLRGGDFAQADTNIAVFINPEDIFVQALIPAEKAGNIYQGDPVSLKFTDGRRQKGTIAKISYRARDPRYVGLPQNYDESRYIRVDIETDGLVPEDVGVAGKIHILSHALGALMGQDILASIGDGK